MKISEIIIATDLNEASSNAARWATALAHILRIPLHYIHVVETGRGLFASSLNSELKQPEKLDEIRTKVVNWVTEKTGEVPDHVTVNVGNASDALREFIQGRSHVWLVLGQASHSGIARIALGSLTYKMAQQPLCPTVIVHPDHATPKPSSVVVGTDLSPYSRRAVNAAVAFAVAMGSDVDIVHANPAPPVTVFEGTNVDVASLKAQAFERADAQMKDLLAELSEHYPAAKLRGEVSGLYPADALLQHVEERQAQHLFLGYSHESPLMQVVLGSTSLRCLNHMTSNLILVP